MGTRCYKDSLQAAPQRTQQFVHYLLNMSSSEGVSPAANFSKTDEKPLFKEGRPAIGIQERGNN